MGETFMRIGVSSMGVLMVASPVFSNAQATDVLESEIRAQLTTGDLTDEERESIIQSLAEEARDSAITSVESEPLDEFSSDTNANAVLPTQEPSLGVGFGFAAFIILVVFISWVWRRMHHGGALGSSFQ